MLRKITIKLDEITYNILATYCFNNVVSPRGIITRLINDYLDDETIEQQRQVSEELLLKICGKTGHNPLYVEKILRRFHDNWRLQAQTLFRPSMAKLEAAESLNDFIEEVEPCYDEIILKIAEATGYSPSYILTILKRYPSNLELQFMELFRALRPQIEENNQVSILIESKRIMFNLISLDEFAAEVKIKLQRTLPTELDVARLTDLIESTGKDELPSDKDFEDWLKTLSDDE